MASFSQPIVVVQLYVFSDRSGDPLYISGGQPRWFDSEFVDESYAQDGYDIYIYFHFLPDLL